MNEQNLAPIRLMMDDEGYIFYVTMNEGQI